MHAHTGERTDQANEGLRDVVSVRGFFNGRNHLKRGRKVDEE